MRKSSQEVGRYQCRESLRAIFLFQNPAEHHGAAAEILGVLALVFGRIGSSENHVMLRCDSRKLF